MTKQELTDYFLQSIMKGSIASVKKSINLGVDVNTHFIRFKTPVLVQAIYINNLGIIKLLIEHGADPTIEDKTIGDFFAHIKYTYTFKVYEKKKNKEIYKYVYSYNFQKEMIEKYPAAFKSLYKNDIMNTKIKEEYAHLITSIELDLI